MSGILLCRECQKKDRVSLAELVSARKYHEETGRLVPFKGQLCKECQTEILVGIVRKYTPSSYDISPTQEEVLLRLYHGSNVIKIDGYWYFDDVVDYVISASVIHALVDKKAVIEEKETVHLTSTGNIYGKHLSQQKQTN